MRNIQFNPDGPSCLYLVMKDVEELKIFNLTTPYDITINYHLQETFIQDSQRG